MGENSAIEWTDHTFNPWYGCTKISPGCDNCYAEGWAKRSGLVAWNAPPRAAGNSAWRQPRKWNDEAGKAGIRKRVFCASLGDVFDNQADPAWVACLWLLIWETPNLDWLLLTKRPQNIAAALPKAYPFMPAWGDGWPHVFLGVTAENQTEAERRIPILLRTPAARRFVSCEPLLGGVSLRCLPWTSDRGFVDGLTGETQHRETRARDPDRFPDTERLDWVIAGGESGPGARPMHPAWVRNLRDQCQRAGTPFFFKQWGEWLPSDQLGAGALTALDRRYLDAAGHECHGSRSNVVVHKVGKKAAGATLDGREWREMPTPERQP